MKRKEPVLIDASWWVGGNRQRGIGQYLSYFFEYVYDVASAERVWLFPPAVSVRAMSDFTARFGGKAVVLATLKTAGEELDKIFESEKIARVFLPSPFERPWSLLQHMSVWKKRDVSWEAIIFDLLPLQYENEILKTWPASEQSVYRQGVKDLGLADQLFVISPFTARQVERLLDYSGDKIHVLTFGLTPAWLNPPVRGVPVKTKDPERKMALTISGGEWRKNLSGTLQFFAQYLAKTHELTVICKLSLREHVRFRRLALQLDVYPLVKLLGQVTERDKWRYLYSTQVFLFLSLAEGLGIPLLEARAAGIERIVISQELKDQGFGKLAPGSEVAKSTTRE